MLGSMDDCLQEQRLSYKHKLLELLGDAGYTAIRRILERELPGKMQDLRDKRATILNDIDGLGWITGYKGRFLPNFGVGVAIDAFVDELLSAASESTPKPDEAETKPKLSCEEANIEVRRVLKENPSWHWKIREMAKKVGCSTGLITKCPAWKAYNERRTQLRKEGTIKTVSLTSELEAVLGTGEKNEALQQLIAEQEEDERTDAKQAKLYLSHEKKRRGRDGD